MWRVNYAIDAYARMRALTDDVNDDRARAPVDWWIVCSAGEIAIYCYVMSAVAAGDGGGWWGDDE